MSKIPCFLIARDRFGCLKAMVDYLKQIDELEVIIIDNNSSYQPLLDYYETKPCIVHRLYLNGGNCVLFTDANLEMNKPNFFELYDCTNGYILSDCDLKIDHIPINFMDTFHKVMDKYDWCTKVGFQLRINDLPDTELAKEAIRWEGANHGVGAVIDVQLSLIKAPIDTTFAFYRFIPAPHTSLAHNFATSIRCSRMDAIHLSWYYSIQNPPPPDEQYYLDHIGGWNHYSSRLQNTLQGKDLNAGLV